MDGDKRDRGGARAEGMDEYKRQALPELIHNFGWPSRRWKDADYHVGQKVFGRAFRLFHRTYLDEDGEPCGCAVGIKEDFDPPPIQGTPTRIPLHDPRHGRVDRLYARLGRRTRRWLDHLLRRRSTI